MKEKINKTNVARLLDKAKIAYRLVPYEVDENDLSATHVAEQLGEEIERVFKTLVLRGDKSGYFVCVIPGADEAGYGWMVDGCLRCRATSGIAALSPEEGGFLCEKEEIPGDALRGVPLLRLARTLFKGDPLRYEGDPVDPRDGRKLLLALEGHFERSFGKKIPGLKMFMSAIDG